jgi:hypothetical protein
MDNKFTPIEISKLQSKFYKEILNKTIFINDSPNLYINDDIRAKRIIEIETTLNIDCTLSRINYIIRSNNISIIIQKYDLHNLAFILATLEQNLNFYKNNYILYPKYYYSFLKEISIEYLTYISKQFDIKLPDINYIKLSFDIKSFIINELDKINVIIY